MKRAGPKNKTQKIKGGLFSVTIGLNEELLESFKKFPDLAAAALQAGADYWRCGILPQGAAGPFPEGILPLHFKRGAHGKYGYAKRGYKYLREARKAGKPDMVMSGSLARDLPQNRTFIRRGKDVRMRLWAPVLNFVPTSGENSPDLYVKRKSTSGYPNLRREIKLMLEDEHEAIAQVVASELEKAFADAQGKESDD